MYSLEHGGVLLRRVLGFEATQADADDPSIAVPHRVVDLPQCPLRRCAAIDVRGQSNLDAVQLAGLLGAVAVAAVHLVVIDTTCGSLGG